MSTRRYGDEEVREIFALATTGGVGERPAAAEGGGLSLEQLRQIAEEAGIDPSRVAQAAATFDARGTPAPVQRALGLPVGLSRVVELPRAPTDREWEQLVAELRTTFGAPGQATGTGGLREWRSGDVHVCVEPTEGGERLRITAFREEARVLNGMGFMVGAFGLVMGAVVTAAGKPEKALAVFGAFAGMGALAFGVNLVSLPSWARKRQQQLQAVAESAMRLLSSG